MVVVTKLGMRVLNNAYTEAELVDGLKLGSTEIIRFINQKNMAPVKHLVTQFPSIILETEDVIQEGLIRLIMNIREGKFSGKSSIHTYLYGICRNICLKESQKFLKEKKTKEEEKRSGGVWNNSIVLEEGQEGEFDQMKRVFEAKSELGEKCVEVIDARFGISGEDNKQASFEEVAERLGLSYANARQRFKRCLDKLIQLVNKDQG